MPRLDLSLLEAHGRTASAESPLVPRLDLSLLEAHEQATPQDAFDAYPQSAGSASYTTSLPTCSPGRDRSIRAEIDETPGRKDDHCDHGRRNDAPNVRTPQERPVAVPRLDLSQLQDDSNSPDPEWTGGGPESPVRAPEPTASAVVQVNEVIPCEQLHHLGCAERKKNAHLQDLVNSNYARVRRQEALMAAALAHVEEKRETKKIFGATARQEVTATLSLLECALDRVAAAPEVADMREQMQRCAGDLQRRVEEIKRMAKVQSSVCELCATMWMPRAKFCFECGARKEICSTDRLSRLGAS